MIIIYHRNNAVTSIWNNNISEDIPLSSYKISKTLFELAKEFPNEFIVWCTEHVKDNLNFEEFQKIELQQKVLVSFHLNETPYLTNAIGYVNETPFIKINREVVYPTWLMSSDVGSVNASILLAVEYQITQDANFDYFLNSLAKLVMPLGLYCYSNPNLLKPNLGKLEPNSNKARFRELFRFVKQHYKLIWVFILFTDFLIYEKKAPISSFILSFFYKRRALNDVNLGVADFKRLNTIDNKGFNIDVVIPTIGRKKYLYDTLKDLSNQTLLPKQVIIVEQNPEPKSTSELDFLKSEVWPFKIKHHFTHQAGACNARNLALKFIKNEWVFLADDDIVLDNDFIEKSSKIINSSKQSAFTFRCHLKDEVPVFKTVKQWGTFGSGCSIVKASAIKDVWFDMSFEFGFGEDADFGMQIRNKGIDIIYLSEPSILHLKAPMGGFRTKHELLWQNDKVKPKPSPTIMLYLLKHQTIQQILGYKTILFFKFFKLQSNKNPITYFFDMKKRWRKSMYLANQLKTNS